LVVVRKMPETFEGDRVRTCLHFQWVWCPRILNNLKCQVLSPALIRTHTAVIRTHTALIRTHTAHNSSINYYPCFPSPVCS
jgi:hypothetical protein